MTSKPQGKRISLKLKSQILAEILLPNASIPIIAQKHNLSSTTLYGWRINHNRKINQNLSNNQESPAAPENNFIEILSKGEPLSSKALTPKTGNSKLSEISLTLNNISLSLKGNIGTSSLIKILSALEEEVC